MSCCAYNYLPLLVNAVTPLMVSAAGYDSWLSSFILWLIGWVISVLVNVHFCFRVVRFIWVVSEKKTCFTTFLLFSFSTYHSCFPLRFYSFIDIVLRPPFATRISSPSRPLFPPPLNHSYLPSSSSSLRLSLPCDPEPNSWSVTWTELGADRPGLAASHYLTGSTYLDSLLTFFSSF